MDKNIVFEKLEALMRAEFELEDGSISLETRINEDLELDSLDMVDLILALNDHTREKVDPNLFKDACTVQDLVDLVQPLWKTE